MKKAIILACCVALVAACGTTKKSSYPVVDERNVPEKFVKDFKKQKPGVEQVKWEKIDSLTYRANFASKGNQMRMVFTNAAVLSSWIIPLEYCENIKSYVHDVYGGYKINEVLLSELDRKKKVYIVTISKGKNVRQLEFDLTQQFVKELTPNEPTK
ncbi:MAG: hypothetical protein LBL74_03225 [Bacteroidales bacterium]|jgi:hypothetical protein|nr:hypothetical protein [Bacteroidales bacterium]